MWFEDTEKVQQKTCRHCPQDSVCDDDAFWEELGGYMCNPSNRQTFTRQIARQADRRVWMDGRMGELCMLAKRLLVSQFISMRQHDCEERVGGSETRGNQTDGERILETRYRSTSKSNTQVLGCF